MCQELSLPNASLELRQGGCLDGDVCAPAGPDTPKGGHAPLREEGAEPRHPVRFQASPVAHTHREFLAERLSRVLEQKKIYFERFPNQDLKGASEKVLLNNLCNLG